MWTYPPHRILVAVDFGEASAHAVRLAGQIAATFDSKLLVVHAESFEAPPYFTMEQVRAVERQHRGARAEAQRHLERFAKKLTDRELEARIADGVPGAAVIEAARDQDLIVMGTHGRRGPARWWAGSVAERVVRESKVPVLVVRSQPAPGGAVFKRITVVAGRGAFDGPARRYARGLATAFDGEVSRESARSLKAATLEDATLVVVARPSSAAAVGYSLSAADDMVRNCQRPILFVPTV